MMRKKLLSVFVLCCMGIFASYASATKTSLNFTVNGPKTSAINLYKIIDGQAVRIEFLRPDANGNCKFNIDEKKESIYFFAKAGGKASDYKYAIYLKAGEQKQINLYLGKLSLDYDSAEIVKPNAETKILQAYTDKFNAYTKSVINTTKQSYTKYAQLEKETTLFLKMNKTANAYFNTWMTDKINIDLKYLRAANYFSFGRRLNTKYDSSATVKDFYKPLLNKEIVSDPKILRSEHGIDMLNYVFGYWKFNKTQISKDLGLTPFANNLPFITNNGVKVAYLISKMPNINKYEDFVKEVVPYKALFVNEGQKAIYQKKYEDLYLFAVGTPGYNFELKDKNDKVYTLASFKGKVVIIDIWAMWCAPCLEEKPIMEKIAEELHDRKDLVFVGVSVDGISAKNNWKTFIEKRGFTSVELLSNHSESINKYYKIEGIPRFLIFDKEGKIVTVDAPRPSTPGFKKIILATLDKN